MDHISEMLEAVSKASGIKKIGKLGAGDSISILPAGGRVIRRYLDGSEKSELVIQLLARGTEQKAVIARISEAADGIVSKARALNGAAWQIFSAKLAANPSPIVAEPNGSYIYQGQVVLIYNKHKEE